VANGGWLTDDAVRLIPRKWYGLLVFATLFLSGFWAPRLVDRPYSPAQGATVGQLRVWSAAQSAPAVSARAYLLYDLDAGQLLLGEQTATPRPPASLAKLMTALLVFERNELTRTVTVLGSDLVGGATMELAAGEWLTVEELLWGLLVPSGNDAAMALARATAGSVDPFVAQMNERAAELGLAQTHFVNPHGLDEPDQQSSAGDLLQLTLQLWEYPLFRQMARTVETTVAGRVLRNTNELLPTLPGAIGVKTGTSEAAGQGLIANIQRNGRQVIVIVLGSRDRYSDVRALYAHYRTAYQWVTPGVGEIVQLNRLYAPNGDLWYLRPVGGLPALLLRPWESPQLRSYRRIRLPAPDVDWSPGMEVGVVEWRLGDTVVGSQVLVLW
jgi:serine-type D-Ala-D-Ala carboxypeptidase (penicillin-binding protein 5/6)